MHCLYVATVVRLLLVTLRGSQPRSAVPPMVKLLFTPLWNSRAWVGLLLLVGSAWAQKPFTLVYLSHGRAEFLGDSGRVAVLIAADQFQDLAQRGLGSRFQVSSIQDGQKQRLSNLSYVSKDQAVVDSMVAAREFVAAVDAQQWEKAYTFLGKSAQSLEEFSGEWNLRWLSPDSEDWKISEIQPAAIKLLIMSSRGSLSRTGDPRVKLYELTWRKQGATWHLAQTRPRSEDDW